MYTQREPLGGMSENRIFSVLTVENLAGGGVGGAIAYGLCQILGVAGAGFGAGFILMATLILGGIALGTGVTVRFSGLSLFDRVNLGIGFLLRRASGGHVLEPPIETSAWALDDGADDLLDLLTEDEGVGEETVYARST